MDSTFGGVSNDSDCYDLLVSVPGAVSDGVRIFRLKTGSNGLVLRARCPGTLSGSHGQQ